MDSSMDKGIKLIQERMTKVWHDVDALREQIDNLHNSTKRYRYVSCFMIILCSVCVITNLIVHTKWWFVIMPIVAILANIGYLVYAHRSITKIDARGDLPTPHDLDSVIDILGLDQDYEAVFSGKIDLAKHRKIVQDLMMFGIYMDKGSDIKSVVNNYVAMKSLKMYLVKANKDGNLMLETQGVHAFSELINALERDLYTIDQPCIEQDWIKDNVKWNTDGLVTFVNERKENDQQ